MNQTRKPNQKNKGAGVIEITCQSGLPRINSKNIRIILRKILQLLKLNSACVSVVLCGNKFIKPLNRKFFKKFRATDVISFPLRDSINSQYLGEIVVSVEQAKKMCTVFGKKWQEELTLYLVHGILHLTGYNDIRKREREKMERKQEEILSKILKKHKNAVSKIGG